MIKLTDILKEIEQKLEEGSFYDKELKIDTEINELRKMGYTRQDLEKSVDRVYKPYEPGGSWYNKEKTKKPKIKEEELTEAGNLPSNIEAFAKKKGCLPLAKTVAGWRYFGR
jgi:hypothetical protein